MERDLLSAAAVLAVLIALVGFLGRYWFNTINKSLEKTNDRLGVAREQRSELKGRVDELMHEHDSIKDDIRAHVEREETLLWPKVDDLTARLIRIEASLPNGELRTLLYRFNAMETKLDASMRTVLSAVETVSSEQRTHDLESEDWKRRILRLEDHENIDHPTRRVVDGPKQGA